MACLNLELPLGELSITSTPKTFLTVKAPANQRIKIKGFEIYGKGVSNTDTPVKVEINIVTTDGNTGTATAVTPQPFDGDLAETPQGTYFKNYGTEPTTYGANKRTLEIHPQTGLVVYYPLHDEIVVKGGIIIGFRFTSNQNETMAVTVLTEE